MRTNRARPTPPIALASPLGKPVISATRYDLSPSDHQALEAVCEVERDRLALIEEGRDWWPLAMTWAVKGDYPAAASAICRPKSTQEVSAVLAICNQRQIPVTPAAGRSGVLGGSIPVHGGVQLDLTGLNQILSIDEMSGLVTAQSGIFGDVFEDALNGRGLTVGHWPQSIALSTVGGWVACRGAGQMSNRYGKIEDIVESLEVVLPDGSVVEVGRGPRSAVGPSLLQLFVGSEGTLGVVTSATMRAHKLPPYKTKAAYTFASFTEALEATRRTTQLGAQSAVMRVYDQTEAMRYEVGPFALVLILDEGEETLVQARMRVLDREFSASGGTRLENGPDLVDRWFEHRNDVAALETLISKGYVVDTMEVSGRWVDLSAIYENTTKAIGDLDNTLVASAHQSHSYHDGACLYFTFAAKFDLAGLNPDEALEQKANYYARAWDAGVRASTEAGATLSHHHGVGLNRSQYLLQSLGRGADIWLSVKRALDPQGIMNPGKLGQGSKQSSPSWPR